MIRESQSVCGLKRAASCKKAELCNVQVHIVLLRCNSSRQPMAVTKITPFPILMQLGIFEVFVRFRGFSLETTRGL